MRVALLSYSGRFGEGNCSKVLDLIQAICGEVSAGVRRLHAADLRLTPCIGCTYECMQSGSSCPHADDVAMVYRTIMDADSCIFALPVYSGAPPAAYFAWRERSQSVFTSQERYERYRRVKKGFIVIGNREAGGEYAVEFLRNEDRTEERAILLLENHRYGLNSLSGKLVEVPEVRQVITEFTYRLLERGQADKTAGL